MTTGSDPWPKPLEMGVSTGKIGANGLGALWMLGAAIGFSINGALVKALLGLGVDVFVVAFARAFLALLPLLPFLYRDGLGAFRTDHPATHFLRALFGAGAMVCGFWALSRLSLAEVTALGFTAPLFTIVLAVLILREPVRWRRWTATAVGFAGVLIMVRPVEILEGGIDPAVFAALGMAFGIAMAITLVKRFPAGESQAVMLLYFCIASILVTAVPAVVAWRTPEPVEWLLFAGVGFVGLASQAMMIKAFRTGEASFVAPFDYAKLIFAGALGFFFFGEVPDAAFLAGALVIIAATLYIARREARIRPSHSPHASERAQPLQ